MEDVEASRADHPLLDEYWESKNADLSNIEVPAYVVASWSDQGLHTRGTLEGFKQISSAEKWLEVHGRKKWQYYYQDQSLARQRSFFDHFLKGEQTDVLEWPRVRIEVREASYTGAMRAEQDWPLERTVYRKLFLDAATRTMSFDPAPEAAKLRYEALDPHPAAWFDHEFTEQTELTGPMKLRVWVEAEGSDDMDLFVGVWKLSSDGEIVHFPFFTAFDDGPVALGWLRVSHRELDSSRSTLEQPWHSHKREQRLVPGEVAVAEIEIWPSSTLFAAGDRIRLQVQGTDINVYDRHLFASRHEWDRNQGRHVIHTGAGRDSHLLIPVVPSRTG